MSEYICKEELIEWLEQRFCEPSCKKQKLDAGEFFCHACNVADILDEIEDFIPADVEPVVHAKWVYYDGEKTCSNCYRSVARTDDFGYEQHFDNCPNCRAKMDLE